MPNSTSWIPVVTQIENIVDSVSAEDVNPILAQYTQRTQYLYEQITTVQSGSVLVALNQQISQDPGLTAPVVGDVVYWVGGTYPGLAKANAIFSASATSGSYLPDNNSFPFGIVKAVSGGFVDVYVSGLAPIDITSSLQTGETFRVGPYYLSRTEKGKVTANPGGVVVYVGYAKDITGFLINPSVRELLQIYLAYNFDLLDRPAGVPTLGSGTWTIVNDVTKLGWISTDGDTFAPAGSYFKYNIPADLDADTALTEYDRNVATALRSAFPPQPFNSSVLTNNGVIVKYNSTAGDDGVYVIQITGIYWLSNADGEQPWASDIQSGFSVPGTWTPADWDDWKGSDYLRDKMVLYFNKLNPDIRESIVTSLQPKTGSAVKFYDAANPTEEASTGDLLADISVDVSTTTIETEVGTAVKNIVKTSSGLEQQKGDVVTAVTSDGSITVTLLVDGSVFLSSSLNGLGGEVTSIDPYNCDLDGYPTITSGLHRFVKLANPATRSTGLIGKFILPNIIPASTTLKFSLMLVGSSAETIVKNIGILFSYQVSAISSVLSSTVTSVAAFDVPTPAATYTAYTLWKTQPASLVIPAASFAGGYAINFRIIRTVGSSNPYTGDVGVVGVTWSF